MASIWLYNGLWLKLILVDPEHLKVVEAVGGFAGLSPRQFLMMIGGGETLLGLGLLSGILYKQLCIFSIALIVAMNAIGILSGGVPNGLGLVINNLPTVFCLGLAVVYGAGSWNDDASN